ncbi:glutaminyl-peptide cyclotransferase [Flavobacteriaceae bacterium]|nr:glutaminyl-peptide cyclotransferase [Flavobacteriaceae bacterium]
MKHSIVFLVLLLVFNCNSDKSGGFKIQINSTNNLISLGDDISLNITSTNNKVIDSINYFLNNIKIKNQIKLNNNKVGENLAKVDIYSNGKKISLNKKFDIYSNIKPNLMTYDIINEFNHDQKAYTQGLEIYKNFLFESTGLNGKSSLRKINFNTGEIINMINLDYEYFGEGLTVLNDKIYQLTWKNRIGFIYDLELNNIGTFNYGNSQEGWGLCNDGNYIYKSDGTSKIWKLDPNTLEEIDFIDVMTDKSRIKNINELEYIDGKIYANTYQQNRDVVIVINPSNGIVENVIDFSGLRDKVLQTEDLDVMNGIAHNKDKLFVTGKNWSKVFEVKVYSKN